MDTNSNESLKVYSFLVMGDMKSNNYFATNVLWTFGKPYKRAELRSSGVSIVLIS